MKMKKTIKEILVTKPRIYPDSSGQQKTILNFAMTAFLLTVLILLTPASSYASGAVTLGVTLNGSNWKGDNGSGNSSFESSEGGQFGLSANYRVENFYTGISVQGGDYDFNGVAPDQFTNAGVTSVNNTKVAHSDIDILFGYYFWPRVSIFMDLKGVGSKWANNGYLQTFGGLGFGASGFYPLNKNWLLFGTAGFVNGDIKDDDVAVIGSGNSKALTLGGVYTLQKNHYLNVGIKFRKYTFDYDDGNDQEYTLNGLFVGYNYVISW